MLTLLRVLVALCLLGAVFAIPVAVADANSSTQTVCAPQTTVVAGASNGAGTMAYCIHYNPIVASGTDGFYVTISWTGPTTVAGTATATVTGVVGCTVTTDFGALLAPANNGVVSTMFYDSAFLTMTAEQCTAVATITVVIAVVPIELYEMRLNINVQTESVGVVNSGTLATMNYLCGATSGTVNAFSPATTTCRAPFIAEFACSAGGTFTLVSLDNGDPCMKPNMSNFNFLCAATGDDYDAYSNSATVCNTPTVNAAITGTLTATLAGTIHSIIDSWPTLNLAGGLTVSDDTNGWAIHQDPISGDLELLITGWPDLTVHQDPVSGSIQVCGQTGVCGPIELAPILAEISGRINTDVNGTLALSGVELALNQTLNNATFNTQFPDSFEVTNPTSDFWVPVFLWFVAVIVFLWVAKLLAAGASTVGMVFALLGNTELQVLALVILGVALWLEASARERIYARWFRKRREAKESEGRRTTGT